MLEYAARTPLRAGQRSASSKPGYFPGCPGFFFAKSRCDVVISHPLPRHRRNRRPPPRRRRARGRAARRREPPDLVELAHEDVDGGRRADAQRACGGGKSLLIRNVDPRVQCCCSRHIQPPFSLYLSCSTALAAVLRCDRKARRKTGNGFPFHPMASAHQRTTWS